MTSKKGSTILRKDLKVGAVEMTGNASLYPAKSGKQTMGYAFYYSIAGGSPKRTSVSGNSEEELMEKTERYLEKKNQEYLEEKEKIKKEEEKRNRPLTFEEAGRMWYEGYKQDGGRKSYSSIESRGCSLNRIIEVIGGCPIKDIDDRVAEDLIAKCSDKGDGTFYSRSHVDKLQQVFRMVMEYGVDNGHCQKVPKKVAFNKELTEPDKDARYLDDEKMRAVRRAVRNNPKCRALVDLLCTTGLRQEEAFALKMEDFIVLKSGNVEVNIYKTVVEKERNIYKIEEATKTKASKRKISIPWEIYEKVKEYYEKCIAEESVEDKMLRKKNNTERCIFVDDDMGPIRKRRFENYFKRCLKRNGIDFKVTLHMFRHTFVSVQADNMTLDKIALFIGDSVATTSNMYQSLTNKAMDELCANTLDYYKRLEA